MGQFTRKSEDSNTLPPSRQLTTEIILNRYLSDKMKLTVLFSVVFQLLILLSDVEAKGSRGSRGSRGGRGGGGGFIIIFTENGGLSVWGVLILISTLLCTLCCCICACISNSDVLCTDSDSDSDRNRDNNV